VINVERLKRDVVVIGASAGGVQPLKDLLHRLPPDLSATVALVLHRSPYHETHGDPVLAGAVYVAPRDQHMIFNDGMVRLSRGPREHHTRPAIDPLFRSAAEHYGPRVVGVLLSGMGSDGVSGLITIKKGGGVSLVQHPGEAQFGTMPATAIAEDDVDAMLTIDDLAIVLTALARGDAIEAPRPIATP
jgi:two-component system, chemotaxis family, protein-glutamate methylesterase/glutaminase